ERRESTAHQGDSALPDGTLVPHAALRQPAHRIQTLAGHSDDGVDRAPTATTPGDSHAAQEGGRSRRVTPRGGYPMPHAFTGNLGLDPCTCVSALDRCISRSRTIRSALMR